MTADNVLPKPQAIFRQAMSSMQSGNWPRAVACLDAVLRFRPNAPMVHFYRGLALYELRRFEDSLASYDRAIALKPDHPEAHSNRGNALQELKRLPAAVASYDRAIQLKPDFASAYSNRGFAFLTMGRLEEALASCERAIELEPNYAQAFINRGSILTRLDRPEEALANYDRALELTPGHADIYFGRALVLAALKRLDDAIASFDRAIELKPDYADAYWGKSFVALLRGDYEEGWKLEEWRLKGDLYKESGKQYQKPRWTRQFKTADANLPKTLMIYAEAGQGDAIQYARYIPMLKELGIKPVLEVPSSLSKLISTLDSDITVVERSQPLPDFDHFCAIGSLPYLFDTRLSTVPAKFPYLYADAEKKNKWKEKLGNKTNPRIGLVWSGQVSRRIDTSSAKNRSMPLRVLEPILGLPLEFHSLQKDIRPDDVPVLSQFDMIHDHRADLGDFSDTAALVENLDLVITIDTSVAHLAGALGQKLWVMLPFCTDYRWTMEETTTPWYPAASLFRQPAPGDWKSVVSAVAQQLKKFSIS
ncbi:MAG TPA: tetratricopeptide repeat-containing glycosyltransferase family protein [Patescibacteria group bacterium]|nr:tetratricopeptide repeat-containing glycosyltransferase family protein [Patescibacteria group bacterium]